jgi:hypothetical protein
MGSSGMLRHVVLVRTDVSEELSASIFRETRIDERWPCISSQHASVASYGYVPTSPILDNLIMGALSSSESLVITRATRRNIPKAPFFKSSLFCDQKIKRQENRHIFTRATRRENQSSAVTQLIAETIHNIILN